MSAIGACIACRRVFQFSPTHVPSIPVDGVNEPVCRSCFERWKQIHNRPDHPLHPDAYLGDVED